MNGLDQSSIRLLILASVPGSKTDYQALQEMSSEIFIVGIAHSECAVIQQAENTQPD
jgi:hypothetical protein